MLDQFFKYERKYDIIVTNKVTNKLTLKHNELLKQSRLGFVISKHQVREGINVHSAVKSINFVAAKARVEYVTRLIASVQYFGSLHGSNIHLLIYKVLPHVLQQQGM